MNKTRENSSLDVKKKKKEKRKGLLFISIFHTFIGIFLFLYRLDSLYSLKSRYGLVPEGKEKIIAAQWACASRKERKTEAKDRFFFLNWEVTVA